MKTNLLRLRFCQLLFKLRVFVQKLNIPLDNVRVTGLKRKCECLNLVDYVHIVTVFHTRLKVFGKVNNVFNSTHNVRRNLGKVGYLRRTLGLSVRFDT